MSASLDVFDTPRLLAERLHPRHLDDLVALHLDPEVSRYLGGVRSPQATADYLSANLAHWDEHGFGLWALKTRDGEFAGRAVIRHVVVGDMAEVEVAYSFRRNLWGSGLASEITGALVALGLQRLRLPSLVGFASIGNEASRRVLEKSAFAFERTAIHHGEEVAIYRRG
jgi:RimJ/RimL family protein N-acetyltransferase